MHLPHSLALESYIKAAGSLFRTLIILRLRPIDSLCKALKVNVL
jgi:hypothetical protein